MHVSPNYSIKPPLTNHPCFKSLLAAAVALGLSQLPFCASAGNISPIIPTTDTATMLAGDFYFGRGVDEIEFLNPVNFHYLDQILGPFHNPGSISVSDNGSEVMLSAYTFATLYFTVWYPHNIVGTLYPDQTGSYISSLDNSTVINWDIYGVNWLDDQGVPTLNGAFTFTAQPGSVPDGGSTLAFLAVASAGLAWFHLRRASSRAEAIT